MEKEISSAIVASIQSFHENGKINLTKDFCLIIIDGKDEGNYMFAQQSWLI